MKMVNFAALDPTIERKGMGNVSKLDREVWQKFFSDIDQHVVSGITPEDGFEEGAQTPYDYPLPETTEAPFVGLARRGQMTFRKMVLASYDGKCAVTGIADRSLLIASHIAPWATHPQRRLDPRNGICLNALHDRAFDRGLIGFDDDLRLIMSARLAEQDRVIIGSLGRRLNPPDKFAPDMDLMRLHRDRFAIAA